MKKLLIGITIILVAVGIGIYSYSFIIPSTPTSQSPSPIASPDIMTASCDNPDLESTLESEGAAGNIFVTVTIKNVSDTDCQINGTNFLELGYDPSINNVTITHPTEPTVSIFTLAPNQTIYSQIHYPNGPQCSGAPKFQPFAVTYDPHPNGRLLFLNTNGNTFLSIPICTDSNEKTEIQIWPFSEKPITQ